MVNYLYILLNVRGIGTKLLMEEIFNYYRDKK